jgi:cysteine desulfuration protein SufE
MFGNPQGQNPNMASFQDIVENLEFLDDWEDRYRYVIELARELTPIPDERRNDANKVRGCVSQVWLITTETRDASGQIRLNFVGDSDAHIVRGLIAILIARFSGETAQDILGIDIEAVLNNLGLREHLTPQRSNGLSAMVKRIRNDARTALEAA